MALELGDRLVDVGLLTRGQLAQHGAVPHGAALVRRLLAAGLIEEALVGFFLSEGFGPLAPVDQLRAADADLVSRVPAEMLWDFMVLPLLETRSGVLVAMAVPSDRHLVRETARLIGGTVLPTVARFGELERELSQRHPRTAAIKAATVERHDSEPPVLHLTRRRSKPASAESAVVAPSVAVSAPAVKASFEPIADDEVPLPLVRHKPVMSKPPPAPTPSAAPPPAASTPPASNTPVDNKVGKIAAGAFGAPVSRSASAAAFREGKAGKSTTSEYPSGAGEPREKYVGRADAAEAARAKAELEGAATVDASIEDVQRMLAGKSLGAKSRDSWDLPAPAPKADTKLSAPRTALPSSKAAAGDITATLSSMKSARDRDAIVRLACEGAVSVGRSSVFLALRKGVLKGWDGAGVGVSRDSVRNLWIPSGSDSMFKRVIDSGAPIVGPYGAGIADGLFRAAVGSRGGDVAVWPVALEGKVVGLLCVDDLRPGSISRHRIETLTVAIADGFRRLINTGRSD